MLLTIFDFKEVISYGLGSKTQPGIIKMAPFREGKKSTGL